MARKLFLHPYPVAGLLVDVYRNLHTDNGLSLRAAEGPDKGRVVAHAGGVRLADCAFLVNETARQRIIRKRRKEVMAVVRGRVVAATPLGGDLRGLAGEQQRLLRHDAWDVAFNPYFTPLFCHRDTSEPIHTAALVVVVGGKVVARR